MTKRASAIIIPILLLSFSDGGSTSLKPSPPQAGGGCILVANSEVWLNVWEVGPNNQKGRQLFSDLHLVEDQTKEVQPVPGDRIIYNSKNDASGQYARETISPCENHDRVVVP